MKRLKKVFAIFLALLVMPFGIPVFAAGETGTITVNNAVKGQTYTVYRILDLESYNADLDAYSYKAASGWEDFVKSDDVNGVYLTVNSSGYVSWVDGADAASFTKLAQAYADGVENQGSIVADSTTVKFTDLPLGYYLLDSTLGSLCALDTTNPDITVNEKNGEPVNVKTVMEDSTSVYGNENDADIGQTVYFKSTITAKNGAENYTFHDKMDDGLTYEEVTWITRNGSAVDSSSYTVVTASDGDTFDIYFTKDFCSSLSDDDQIVISYTAVLNENAVIGKTGNKNESRLEYGETGNTTFSIISETTTRTWEAKVLKYALKDENEIPLAGASFTLDRNKDGSDLISFVAGGDNTYRVAMPGENDTITEITTDDSGQFTITGLDSDTYYLTETAAPAGYNILSEPVEIVIGDDGAINADADNPEGIGQVKVLNRSGSMLPGTGGIGTTIFYVVGSVLVVGAAVLFVTKKRLNGKE